jgi:hypothetical protein
MLIHADTMQELVSSRMAEIARRAEQHARWTDEVPAPTESPVLVRMQRASDEQALVRLAQLDSTELPAGCLVVAERDGMIIAAAPVDASSRPIADPFRPTADAVRLVLARATAIRRSQRPSAVRRLRLAFQRV